MKPALGPGAGASGVPGNQVGGGSPPGGGWPDLEDRPGPGRHSRRSRHLVSRALLLLAGLVVLALVLALPLVLWVFLYSLVIAKVHSFGGGGDPRWLLVVVPAVGLGAYLLLRYGANAIADSILQLRRVARPFPPAGREAASSMRQLDAPASAWPLIDGSTRADPAALGNLLAGRLARVLGDGFAVIASPDGDSILLQHGERSHVIRVPVDRMRFLPAGEAVSIVARQVMSETQRFATLTLGWLWPASRLDAWAEGPVVPATARTTPRVTVTGTTVRLVWQDRVRIVARLASFDLSQVEVRSPNRVRR